MDFLNMATFGYDYIISNTFRTNLMPIVWDIGKTILWVSIPGGFYLIMRRNHKEGWERIKWACIGYIGLKFTDTFVNIVDKIANNMHIGG